MSPNVTLNIESAQVNIPLQVLLDQLAGNARVSASAPKIGELWPGQGGIYAGVMRGQNGQPDYHLILAVSAGSKLESVEWGGYGETVSGANCDWDGQANTKALLADDTSHPAAEKAAAVSADGHSDFYLPSKRESALLYANLPDEFESAWYWTSTQRSASDAVTQCFGHGYQSSNSKDSTFRVRAVRRLTI